MEITEYLKSVRDRLWILIVVPVLAVSLFLVMSMASTDTYSATATVAGPWVVGAPNSPYLGAQGAADFVADFSAATTLDPVVGEVAQATGAPVSEVREGITSTPIGESAIVQVRYETHDESDAAPVAKAVATESLEFLFAPQVMLAQRSLEQGEARVGDAEGALIDFAEENGLTLPASGAELRALGADLATYRQLEQQRDEAVSRFGILQAELDQANRLFEGAGEDFTVTVTDPRSVPSGGLGGLAVAAGAGLFLAVGIVVMIDLALPQRRPQGTPVTTGRAGQRAGLRRLLGEKGTRLAAATRRPGGGSSNRKAVPSQIEEPKVARAPSGSRQREGAAADGAAIGSQGSSATRAGADARGSPMDEDRSAEASEGRVAARASRQATESQRRPNREQAEPERTVPRSKTKRTSKPRSTRGGDKGVQKGKSKSRASEESETEDQRDSTPRTVESKEMTLDKAGQKKPNQTEEPESAATVGSAADEGIRGGEDKKEPTTEKEPTAENDSSLSKVGDEDASAEGTPKKPTPKRTTKTRSSTRASSESPPSDSS